MSYGTASLLGSVPPVLPAGATALVGGPASSTDNAIARWDGTTGALLQNSSATLSDNGDLMVPSTATVGVQIYNTVDQATNYERVEMVNSPSNSFLRRVIAGSGTALPLRLSSSTASAGAASTLILDPANNPRVSFGVYSGLTGITQVSTGTTGTFFSLGNITSVATSGTVVNTAVTPTYNQASGTAANTDFLVNRTQTAVGSGTQLLIDAQVGGVSQFSVSNTGVIAIRNTVGAAVAVASTHKVTINIGGVTYYLLATNVA
jgi:hypothetical protein